MIVAALVLTFSRGAFFGFFVVNALFLLSRRSAGALALGALLVAGLLLALPGAFYDRLMAGFGGDLNAVTAGRINSIWLPLLPELWRSPIYGNGLGSILWSDAMLTGQILSTTHPHNAYLQALLDMGVAGLVLLCAYFAHVWKGFRALSVDPSVSPTLQGFYLGAAAGLARLLIAGVTDSSLAPVTGAGLPLAGDWDDVRSTGPKISDVSRGPCAGSPDTGCGIVSRTRGCGIFPAQWRACDERGPDDSGTWVRNGGGVALGHTRLSILDLSPLGHQPMVSDDGDLVMVFNGEIYNFAEIRAELEKRGHHFRSSGDSEVVLAALRHWGIAAVDDSSACSRSRYGGKASAV